MILDEEMGHWRERIKGWVREYNWHIGDGVDDCSGHDEKTMEKAIDFLAAAIVFYGYTIEREAQEK